MPTIYNFSINLQLSSIDCAQYEYEYDDTEVQENEDNSVRIFDTSYKNMIKGTKFD